MSKRFDPKIWPTYEDMENEWSFSTVFLDELQDKLEFESGTPQMESVLKASGYKELLEVFKLADELVNQSSVMGVVSFQIPRDNLVSLFNAIQKVHEKHGTEVD